MAYHHKINRIRQVTDAATGKVAGKYRYDDQGFRVHRVSEKTNPDTGEKYTIEMKYQNQYYGFEHQCDSAGLAAGCGVIAGSHQAVNNVYLNGVRVAAVTGERSVEVLSI